MLYWHIKENILFEHSENFFLVGEFYTYDYSIEHLNHIGATVFLSLQEKQFNLSSIKKILNYVWLKSSLSRKLVRTQWNLVQFSQIDWSSLGEDFNVYILYLYVLEKLIGLPRKK